MHEGLGKSIENALIEIGVLARKIQSHILAAVLGNVADDARETAEERSTGTMRILRTHLCSSSRMRA